ncbi:hypothetical protein KA005_83345 [bacterium]|nr:hypothetical protein [bacterium]
MSNIKIASDGICNHTEVTLDGKRINGVTKIEIHPITAKGDFIEATLTFELGFLDLNIGDLNVRVDDPLVNDKIKAALLNE